TQIRASQKSGFPENLPGILMTYNVRYGNAENYWSWQEYKPHKSQTKYIRRWDSDNNEWHGCEAINAYKIDLSKTVTNNTTLDNSSLNTVTESMITSSQSEGFPKIQTGELITHNPRDYYTEYYWGYQEFKARYSNQKYIRYWSKDDETGKWSDWESQNNYIIDTSFTVKGSTPITDFDSGAVTESTVRTNQGMPGNKAGVLVTHRPFEKDLNWSYQEFKPIYTNDKYLRHWTANTASGNWSAWKKYVM